MGGEGRVSVRLTDMVVCSGGCDPRPPDESDRDMKMFGWSRACLGLITSLSATSGTSRSLSRGGGGGGGRSFLDFSCPYSKLCAREKFVSNLLGRVTKCVSSASDMSPCSVFQANEAARHAGHPLHRMSLGRSAGAWSGVAWRGAEQGAISKFTMAAEHLQILVPETEFGDGKGRGEEALGSSLACCLAQRLPARAETIISVILDVCAARTRSVTRVAAPAQSSRSLPRLGAWLGPPCSQSLLLVYAVR